MKSEAIGEWYRKVRLSFVAESRSETYMTLRLLRLVVAITILALVCIPGKRDQRAEQPGMDTPISARSS